MKKRSYSLLMDETKELRKHIGEFNKVILDLENTDIKVEEEDQAILLLSYLPKVLSLNSKEMYMKSENKEVVNEHEEEQRKGIQETIEGSLA